MAGKDGEDAEKYLAAREKYTRLNTYPKNRLEHCPQLSDVSTKRAIFPYSPVPIPVIGRPVTVRDDGSECGSNVAANSKSSM